MIGGQWKGDVWSHNLLDQIEVMKKVSIRVCDCSHLYVLGKT